MIVNGDERRHYTVIKSICRLLSRPNGKTNHEYHYCMNCLNGYCTEPVKNKHYGYSSSHGYVKVNMSTEKEKWLKFHDGQYQVKVPFTVYAGFENILKPVAERYRDKMNTMKAERKSTAPYTEKINTNLPSGSCVHTTFFYGDIPDALKMYRSKDVLEKFIEHIEDE